MTDDKVICLRLFLDLHKSVRRARFGESCRVFGRVQGGVHLVSGGPHLQEEVAGDEGLFCFNFKILFAF